MRTGLTVIGGMVLVVAALVGWAEHDEAQKVRVAAVARARSEFATAVYVTATADYVASRGSRGLSAAFHQKASADYADARGKSDAAERAYMEACKACSSAMECERDRLVIVSGRSSDSYNPCER